MKYQVNAENAIANRGNWSRLKNVMKKAKAGEELTIGFIGGSITQGCLSSVPETCYAYLVYEWWCEKFPNAKLHYLNAGIGATTSQLGVARVHSDLLDKQPDFVITEFSVNDESDEHFLETYEGLVREIYQDEKDPAIVIVNNVYYHNGANAQLQHAKIGRHYQIPCVSMQSSIYPEVVAGKIENREITPDDLHPNDNGHRLVADIIIYFLEKVAADLQQEEEMVPMPAPYSRNSYQHSTRYQNYNTTPVLEGFEEDDEPQEMITDIFKRGWYASRKGDRITFQIAAKGISVQYRKSVKQPAPIARIVIDHDEEHAVILDANFTETWGDKMELDTIVDCGEYKEHHICIELVDVKEDNQVPFYLVSIIGTK